MSCGSPRLKKILEDADIKLTSVSRLTVKS